MGLRQIVLDTETTGLSPDAGHRVVEIACAELIDYVYTGRHYHVYVNPERDVPPEAEAVHGLKTDFLKTHPVFTHHAESFLDFIENSELIIHNAPFDMKFLNFELGRLKRKPLPNPVTDTLAMARRKFPGSPVTLDALCKRFNIDLSDRTKHGALIDVLLLSKVYLDLTDKRTPSLGISEYGGTGQSAQSRRIYGKRPYGLPSLLTPEEKTNHEQFIAQIKGVALWTQFLVP